LWVAAQSICAAKDASKAYFVLLRVCVQKIECKPSVWTSAVERLRLIEFFSA